MSSRYTMRDVVEKTGIKFDPVRVREEWALLEPKMARAGFLNACLPKDGVERLDYFYVQHVKVESYLEGTIFEEVFNALPIKINRGTFLKLYPNQSLRYHRDPDNKIHLPITDMPGSFFYDFERDKAYNIEANGELLRYWTAGRYHSAFNASCFDRTHLVFAEYHCRDSDPDKLWTNDVILKVPKTIRKFPPKISTMDSIEQSFMAKWMADVVQTGWIYSGAAVKSEDDDYWYRTYTMEYVNPDEATKIAFGGQIQMNNEVLKKFEMSISVGEIVEKS